MTLPFDQLLAQSWPPNQWGDVGVVLAVSGGPDSVALLRAMVELRPRNEGRLIAAHFNHGLRGQESDADEQFVAELCRKLDVPCVVGHVGEPLAPSAPDGIEAAARASRYDFFLRTTERWGARYLATGHTADDQAETILHRILRGTGIAGLEGMPRVRLLSPAVTLIRPMLGISRQAVEEYLAALGQPYRIDASNADLQFTRNRIRHDLLPRLAADYNAEVRDALLRLGSLAGEVQQLVDGMVARLLPQVAREQTARELQLDATRLAAQPPYLVRETLIALWRGQAWPLQAMGRQQWEQLAQLTVDAAQGVSRKHVFPGEIHATAADGQLRLARRT
jgi:tRNA(Ile)-lysidine synthase